MGLHLFRKPGPGLDLAQPRGLLDGNMEIGQLALNLFTRQHMETAHQNCGLDHCSLSAIEPLERRVGDRTYDTTTKAWPLWIILDVNDSEFGMRQRIGKTGNRNLFRRYSRPHVPAGKAAGKHTHVIGVVGGGERDRGKVVKCGRGAERRNDPVIALCNKAYRSNMSATSTIGRDHDCLPN